VAVLADLYEVCDQCGKPATTCDINGAYACDHCMDIYNQIDVTYI
jgi:hypothetical protein